MNSVHQRQLILVLILATAALSATGQTEKPKASPIATPPKKVEASKPYDEQADARQQIAEAVARAHKENRRVLIQWGGNWCGWCIKLHNLYKSDKEIAHELLYEYDVVFVDTGRPNDKNLDLAKFYGADVMKYGFPYLTILDDSGKPIANEESSQYENKDQETKPGHDPALILALLKKHQAPYRSAEDVLKDGLTQAQQSGKIVFLHFGAPWCGWCHKMEAWMQRQDVHPLLDKQFIDVKIDVERTVGGKEILARYNSGNAKGLPWFAFIDASGKSLADSTMTSETPGEKVANTGFPQEAAEIAHFKAMLKNAGQKLSDAEIQSLCDSLAAPRATAAAQ
jgi:thiol-disulfide isomerase/thioredoxin